MPSSYRVNFCQGAGTLRRLPKDRVAAKYNISIVYTGVIIWSYMYMAMDQNLLIPFLGDEHP